MNLQKKLNQLREILRQFDRLAIAYSGGVDSTFLLKIASDVLKERALAVTVKSLLIPRRDLQDAHRLAKFLGVKHLVVGFDVFAVKGFQDNSVNRCYLCKRALLSRIVQEAARREIPCVVEGSTLDDLHDFRPGKRAITELGIVCPLKEAGLTKGDIRNLSKRMGIPTWNKPSGACLASRIPYGEKITTKKLKSVDRLEQYLVDCGFEQVRVRHHGNVARIEVAKQERRKVFNVGLMDHLYEKFRAEGFTYVTLDLAGYRSGSMNESLRGRQAGKED